MKAANPETPGRLLETLRGRFFNNEFP